VRRWLRPLGRLAIAVALLALAVAVAGPARLRSALTGVAPGAFSLALLAMAAAQAVSVLRWQRIAQALGLHHRLAPLARAYAQGMTVNALLPGATLGGDTLRSLRLQSLGNPLPESALSVLVDRLSGLWVLCVLSLATGLVLGAPAGAAGPLPAVDWSHWRPLYLGGLALAVLLPWVPVPAGRGGVARVSGPGSDHSGGAGATRTATGSGLPARSGTLNRVLTRLRELHALAVERRGPLAASLWLSVLVQVLCAVCLWQCARAAGLDCAFWQIQAVAAPIFVAGALPISYGGFGARELVALAVFPLVGLPPEAGVGASALYGVVGLLMGLVSAPAFVGAGARAPREN
jgi:uncharacterized membrane protein YbhN (UPF0104 family)